MKRHDKAALSDPHESYMAMIRSWKEIYTLEGFQQRAINDSQLWTWTIGLWRNQPNEVFRRARIAASIAFEALPELREK